MWKVFLPPGLIINQTQTFCFAQANPKGLKMPYFILTFIGETVNWGICSKSLFSYMWRGQLRWDCLWGSASSINTQLCASCSDAHLKFPRKLSKSMAEHRHWFLRINLSTKDTQSSWLFPILACHGRPFLASVFFIANKESCTFHGEGSRCSVLSSVKCTLLIFNVPVALRLCQAETFQNSSSYLLPR